MKPVLALLGLQMVTCGVALADNSPTGRIVTLAIMIFLLIMFATCTTRRKH